MRNTKYLFNESQTPEDMISVSQLQTFLSCRKKWEYGYVEEITPRIDRAYLTIGKLCHKGMQAAMQCAWQDQQENPDADYYTLSRWEMWRECGVNAINNEYIAYLATVPLLNSEQPELDKMHMDAVDVFKQAFEEFEPWKYNILTLYRNNKPIPALELHFKVPCPPTKGLHGFIDAIVEDKTTGFIWCTDYKFRKSLAPDEDEVNNIQNVVYAYACEKMGIAITGTMTWQHLNTPAVNPQLLKNGSISRAKIKTTWKKYAKFCQNCGIDSEPYKEEMQEKLSDIEWFRITYEYRNVNTIYNIWQDCIKPVAKLIKGAKDPKVLNFRSLYPWNCKMCQYQSLCQAELREYDVEYIRQTQYTKRIHATIATEDSPLTSVVSDE